MNISVVDEKIVKAKQLATEAMELLQKENVSAEDREKSDRLRDEAKRMQADATNLKELMAIDGEQTVSAPSQKNMEQDKEFKSMADFLAAVGRVRKGGMPDSRLVNAKAGLDPEEYKAMAESTGAAGGFLVPSEQSNNMLAVMAEEGIVRSRAQIIPMSRRTIEIPALDQSSTTAGVPHFFGGVDVYWEEEAKQKPESQPSFRKVILNANKLVGYTLTSDELLDDSIISLDAFLRGPFGFAGALAWKEDYAFFNGTGVGQPLGILNSPVLTTVARDEAGKVKLEDLAAMLAAFYSTGNNGMWVASQSLKAQLIAMKGPDTNPMFLWGDATNGMPDRLLGMPIMFTLDKLPIDSASSTGSLVLADFSYYLIGDRQNMTIESSTHEKFRTDQTAWRAVHRVDGQPWLRSVITSADGTTTVSPFVALGSSST